MVARIAGALVLLIAATALDARAEVDPGTALKGKWTVVRLDPLDERHLSGTLTSPGSGARERVRPLRLEKAE